jgi:polar amino acid transport system permease protein
MADLSHTFFDGPSIHSSLPLLEQGLVGTAKLSAASFALALVLGVPIAAARSSRHGAVSRTAAGIINITRALPPLVALVFAYYVLPVMIGVSLGMFATAALTLAATQSGYVAETYRSAFLAVERGQHRAAESLGLSRFQTLRLVLVPQVMRTLTPPLANQATQSVRDSSLAYVVGYADLVTRSRDAQALTANSSPLMVAMLMYLFILLLLQAATDLLERRAARRTTT